MLRMSAGSVVDSALIVSALRRVVSQDALEAALARIAHKSLRICMQAEEIEKPRVAGVQEAPGRARLRPSRSVRDEDDAPDPARTGPRPPRFPTPSLAG